MNAPLIEMVSLSGGEFQMGSDSPEAFANEKPKHWVIISPFAIGRYPVTQGQWLAVMGSNPAHFQQGDYYPVESVSWYDCREFISKLNELGGRVYRLPTEAEWEYACRAGSNSDCYAELDDIAWNYSNSDNSTRPVGGKQPNAFGLYDMLGNVWEWCLDYYQEKYYQRSPLKNPPGPASGGQRVMRGGSWVNGRAAGGLRAADRLYESPQSRYNYLGFRLAMGELPPPEELPKESAPEIAPLFRKKRVRKTRIPNPESLP